MGQGNSSITLKPEKSQKSFFWVDDILKLHQQEKVRECYSDHVYYWILIFSTYTNLPLKKLMRKFIDDVGKEDKGLVMPIGICTLAPMA